MFVMRDRPQADMSGATAAAAPFPLATRKRGERRNVLLRKTQTY